MPAFTFEKISPPTTSGPVSLEQAPVTAICSTRLLPEQDLSTFPDHALARMKSFKHRLCQM